MQIPVSGKVERRFPTVLGLLSVGLIGLGITTYSFMNDRPVVDLDKLTVPVASQSITMKITASGTVVPFKTVNLSPKSAGRIAQLRVEQGDKVRTGQIIAIMENQQLQAGVYAARARLIQAQATLSEAQNGTRPEQIAQAKARLDQAEAKLLQAENGTRPEEIAQAKAKVESAKASVELAQKRSQRNQDLQAQGAISRDQLDQSLTEYRNSVSALAEAQENLLKLQRGTRVEEIANLSAIVTEAKYTLKELTNGTRPERLQQLRAAVATAEAELAAQQILLEETIIKAPFDGLITQKYANPGAFVTPTTSASNTSSATSTSVVALAQSLEIIAKVPEVDLSQIKLGQEVKIVADAYPSKTFQGKVRLISPEAVVEQNVTSFEVRIEIITGLEQLRSGMNVDLTFVGEKVNNALVIPTVAIVTGKEGTGVLIPDSENKPKFQSITIGSSIKDKTQVLEGLKKGDRVFIDLPKGYKKEQP